MASNMDCLNCKKQIISEDLYFEVVGLGTRAVYCSECEQSKTCLHKCSDCANSTKNPAIFIWFDKWHRSPSSSVYEPNTATFCSWCLSKRLYLWCKKYKYAPSTPTEGYMFVYQPHDFMRRLKSRERKTIHNNRFPHVYVADYYQDAQNERFLQEGVTWKFG